MLDKKYNFISIIIIVVLGLFLTSTIVGSVDTTKFNTEYMEGTFIGNVDLINDSVSFAHSYEDSKNRITYNISTVDDTISLMEIYQIQGLNNPTKVSINNNEWNIYFTKAVSNVDNKEICIIICQSQGDKQGYLIYSIFDSESYRGSLSTSDESYTQFVKPLLESVTLKKSNNVPKIYDQFDLSEQEFQQYMDKIHADLNGDTSALDDASTDSSSSSKEYWASSNSGKFHYPSCEWAQKISSKNKVVFHSRDKAISAGYSPCHVCGP